jgi:hypothetical protein
MQPHVPPPHNFPPSSHLYTPHHHTPEESTTLHHTIARLTTTLTGYHDQLIQIGHMNRDVEVNISHVMNQHAELKAKAIYTFDQVQNKK